MKRKLPIAAICFFCLMLLCSSALAHSGNTDEYGGHTVTETGEYHYHHGYSAHQHDEYGLCPYDPYYGLDDLKARHDSYRTRYRHYLSLYSDAQEEIVLLKEDAEDARRDYSHLERTYYQTLDEVEAETLKAQRASVSFYLTLSVALLLLVAFIIMTKKHSKAEERLENIESDHKKILKEQEQKFLTARSSLEKQNADLSQDIQNRDKRIQNLRTTLKETHTAQLKSREKQDALLVQYRLQITDLERKLQSAFEIDAATSLAEAYEKKKKDYQQNVAKVPTEKLAGMPGDTELGPDGWPREKSATVHWGRKYTVYYFPNSSIYHTENCYHTIKSCMEAANIFDSETLASKRPCKLCNPSVSKGWWHNYHFLLRLNKETQETSEQSSLFPPED